MTNARLEELRAKFQENPRRYFAPFANELRKTGDRAQAIEICRAHLAGQPGHVSGHIVLGQALYEAGETNEARDIFTAALELDPENLIALRSLGEIAQVKGNFGAARQWYERLLDADPRNHEVAQLLKDIPTEAVHATASVEPLPDADEPTPFTVRAEVEEVVKAPEAPRFHTSFTGSGRAYEPDEPEPESTAAEATGSSSNGEAFIDLEPSAHEDTSVAEPQVEPTTAAAPTSDDALDMVDFDSFPEAAAAQSEPIQPDESYEPSMAAPPEPDVVDVEQDEPEAAPPDEFAALQDAESGYESQPEAIAPDEPAETPRAKFAERGFDSPSHDEVGWMTTPSAAFSDPEAAPEHWYDEPGTPEAEASADDLAAVAPDATGESQSARETDSWFDDVEGATAIEATDITSDELWLPPELPSFAVEAVAPHAKPPVEEPAVALAASEPEDVDQEPLPEPVSASREPNDVPEPGWAPEPAVASEPAALDVQAMADAADEAFMVEHPSEAPAEGWVEAAAAESGAGEPVEAASLESDVEIIHAGYESPVSAAMPETVIGHTPESVEAVAPPPAPFVTETLADLYLQQGFREEALAIFRQLLERDPGNQPLTDRIRAIEEGNAPTVSHEEIPVEERASSQSVRTFFSRLARRPSISTAEQAPSVPPARRTPDVPFAAAASALANLFAASKPPASDEGAASTLAGAYTDPAGRPSRAADRELSLDHLFRDVPPGGSPGAGVTLDEFYSSPNAAQGSPTEPGEATASEESGGTDIRQFTAWLEGLRKK